MSLKLISLNIEKDLHLDRVIRFIKDEQPDILCLQEVVEPQHKIFMKKFNMRGNFVPLLLGSTLPEAWYDKDHAAWIGIATYTSTPRAQHTGVYYAKSEEAVPKNVKNPSTWSSKHQAYIRSTVDGLLVMNTHFTWSAEGKTTDLQRDHVKKMIAELNKNSEFVLCGDFNAPRGREIFDMLARKYTDNIPADVTTTIDNTLHRAGHKNLQYVVDGLFTTPKYTVENVRIESGISDHMAIVANIQRRG